MGLFNLTHKTRADALYCEGRYQLDEKLLKTMMKHEIGMLLLRAPNVPCRCFRHLNHDLEVLLAA